MMRTNCCCCPHVRVLLPASIRPLLLLPTTRPHAPRAAAAAPHAGADAVVMVEDTSRSGDTVTIRTRAAPRQHIREVGSDMTVGETVLCAGTLIGPAEIGLLRHPLPHLALRSSMRACASTCARTRPYGLLHACTRVPPALHHIALGARASEAA